MAFSDMRDKSIPQPDPVAAMDSKFVRNFDQWSLDNPHPGFGKDPNIINHLGHTRYPKWVTKPNGDQIIVNNEDEENIALGKADHPDNADWGKPEELKQNGPTVAEYVAAGYDPNNYPPKGYASKSNDEEIQTFIKLHNKSGW